jgi:hypothetical protein
MPKTSVAKLSSQPNDPNSIEFLFDGKVRSVMIDGQPFWSILDTYKTYGNSSNPTRDWKRDLAELKEQGYNLPNLVDYVFAGADGKNKRSTPLANLEGFMRIAQVAKFKEWEPLRIHMAKLMAQYVREKVRQDPMWEVAHNTAKITHMELMNALDEAVYFMCQGTDYEQATEMVFKGLYKRDRDELLQQLRLKGAVMTTQLEKHQTVLALSYQNIARVLAREDLQERAELGLDEACQIIYEAAALIAPQIEATSNARGRDVATDLPLLASHTGS